MLIHMLRTSENPGGWHLRL